MRDGDAAAVLLVRAVEETRPEAIPPDALVDAALAAGRDVDDEEEWLARRARFLLAGPLAPFAPVTTITGALAGGMPFVFSLAVAAGLAANYLGPSDHIHVLFNPIALLVLWNLGVYAALGLHALLHRRPHELARVPAASTAGAPAPTAPSPPGLLTRLVVHRLVPAVWLGLHRRLAEGKARAADVAAVGRRFWHLWIAPARSMLAPLARRALHVGAIGLTLGAIAGMYGRGLVLEYAVVWRSTFLRDPVLILDLLRLALGPAAALTGIPLPDRAHAAALLTAAGAPAAPWIHLYAASALLYVLLPRTLLAILADRRARRATRAVRLDLDDPYYRHLLAEARRLRVARIEDQIRDEVEQASAAFIARSAAFVCERLYDARLAPRLRAFRASGGRLDALEETLAAECRGFRDELIAWLASTQRELEDEITAAVGARIGAQLELASVRRDVATPLGAFSGHAPDRLGGSLGRELADTVGSAVTAALAVAGGTLGGEFAEAIGLAVVAAMLETGPVGWLMGALVGIVAAGATWWLGRDALAARLRQLELPATVVRVVLWPGRLERVIADGRRQCDESVRALLLAELTPLAPAIAEEIWQRLKAALGERQRPGR